MQIIACLSATILGVGLAAWFAERNGMASPTPHPLGVDRVESRDFAAPDPVVAAMIGYTNSGVPLVSSHTALTLSAVYRAMAVVTGALGQLPLRTIETDQDGRSVRSTSFLDNVGGERLTPTEWKEVVGAHLLMHGNAYLQHIRNGSGQLVALIPIHPMCVEPEWAAVPGGKRFKVTTEDGGRVFDARTMTQLMMSPTADDGLRGVSVITAARMSLAGALAGDRSATRLMTNGASLAGVLVPEDEQFDEEDAEAAKTFINQNMLGTENAGDIVVLNQRMKFTPWSMSAADAQFIESRKFSIDEVCRWFGVQPHQLAETEKSTSWGQGIDKLNQGFARETLRPITGRIEDRLTRLVPAGRKAEFDFAAFVEPAPEVKVRLILDQVNGGLITPNEGRRLMNLVPVPEGDVLRTPVGGTPPTDDTPPPADGGGAP